MKMISFCFGTNLNDKVIKVQGVDMKDAMRVAAIQLKVKTCNLVFKRLA